MAVIHIKQYLPLVFDPYLPVDELQLATYVDGDASGAVLETTGGDYLVVYGSDFQFDDGGYLIDGTVTRIQFYRDLDLVIDASGFSLDMAEVEAAYWDDRPYPIDPSPVYNYDARGLAPDEYGYGIEFGGGDGNDTLRGTSGHDYLAGWGGNDSIVGGAGDDFIWGGTGKDTIDGGSGIDGVGYSDRSKKVEVKLDGSKTVTVKVNGKTEDQIKNVEGVVGGSAGDKLTGDSKKNYFQGLGGKDTIDGGSGVDMASYAEKTKKVEVTLNGASEVSVKVNAVVEDKLKNIENLAGGSASDKLTGDAKANMLVGNSGNDTLSGGAGKDSLVGGAGKDVLTGGTQADHFVFSEAAGKANADTIKDFKINEDKIALSTYYFSELGVSVKKGELTFGKEAGDDDDFLIYDKKSGKLYYDADANGGYYAPQLVATLSTKPAIDHQDFIIV